jgi:hypothetical protein
MIIWHFKNRFSKLSYKPLENRKFLKILDFIAFLLFSIFLILLSCVQDNNYSIETEVYNYEEYTYIETYDEDKINKLAEKVFDMPISGGTLKPPFIVYLKCLYDENPF